MQTHSNRSLDSIIQGISRPEAEWRRKAEARTAQLVMPPRALGRLHAISEHLCAIQQTLSPDVTRKTILIMAGDHGIMQEGYSPFPQAVTPEMIKTFLRGGAGINALAATVQAEVRVVDLGIIPDLDPAELEGGANLSIVKTGHGTANFARGPAMSRQQAEQCVLSGFDTAATHIRNGTQLLGTGDMGIGNTSPSAAIGTVFSQTPLQAMVGRGTGVDDPALEQKIEAIQRGLEINRPDPGDGLDVLAKVGGFEIGGIAGLILAGAAHGVPVVLDGFIAAAGALIARALCPISRDFLFAGHCSAEQGHRAMLDALRLEPLLDLNMRLGEGTGAALAMSIIQAAVTMFTQVQTFAEAGVPGA